MACTSPNQWAMTSPTASKSSRGSRLHLTSGDRQDEASDVDVFEQRETEDDALLDHVRQLIVDLLVDDAAELTGGRDVKHRSNNPEAEEDTRERLLEEKLARVLMELATEQDNLRLAANAGNALLQELSTAREEIDALHDDLEAAQLDQERATRDLRRLREQNAALETELQRYDAPYGQQNALRHHQQQLERRPSLTSRTDSCERCASREVEVTQLSQRTDELRRRCLELELARQQRERELGEEITQLQQRSHEQHLETTRVQHDLDFVTAQLTQQAEEVESVQAVRDALRRTARRLEAENEELGERLAVRDELIAKLENGKVRAASQLQVAENRTKSAQAETKLATETMQQLQKQLENSLLQQRQSGRGDSSQRSDEAELKPQASEDMDQLLQDATREVAALRLENRLLRRQSSAETSAEGSSRGRRRKTLCTGNAPVTAADVLPLGKREPKRKIDFAITSCESGSDTKPAPATTELPPLESDDSGQTVVTTTATSNNVTLGDEKKRRKMSLELSWVDMTATDVTDSAVKGKANENKTRGEQQGRAESLTIAMTPSTTKRSTILSRFSHVADDCVVSGDSNRPDMRLYGMEGKRPKRRHLVGGAEHAQASNLAIDELKRDAAESPPKSPLYLGLSFIACATAATAAGLLVRR